MRSTPPMRTSASSAISTQPPAAAAVARRSSFTHANGYSIRKKNTNAGISSRSRGDAQCSATICETSARSSRTAVATRRASVSGSCSTSASENHQYAGCAPLARAAATPSASAHTLPVQPSGRARPPTTRARSAAPCRAIAARASAPVPSSLRSSTSVTPKRPTYSCASNDESVRATTAASLRAGTTACTPGAGPSRSAGRRPSALASQKRPPAATSPTHAAAATHAAARSTFTMRTNGAPSAMNSPASHGSPALGSSAAPVEGAIARAVEALFRLQNPAGYWWAELQSNVTITAEVLLLHHVWGTFDRVPRAAAERYFREEQREHGGWELAYDDGGELSASVEAYMALRMLGVPPDDPALRRARAFILARGGITRARIFTKMHLALIGAYEWSGLPALPPWLMVLPERGPFSIYDLSSWARGSTVPLILLFDRKPVYGPALQLDELYAEGRANARFALPPGNDAFERLFTIADGALKLAERAGIVPFRRRGLELAERWTVERQEHTGDWGGIVPAMLNAMLALRALGYDAGDPVVVRGWSAIDGFTITAGGQYRVQPCISPVWDTGLAVRALVDAGVRRDH